MIFVVVPTIRPEQLSIFKEAWREQFEKYNVKLITVHDGDMPYAMFEDRKYTIEEIMGDFDFLIYNKNDGVRNLGFALAYKLGAEIIISLDDDTRPYGDTIGDHLKILNTRQPISWMNTAQDVYMRGFPYGIRNEAEVVFSHGVWNGVADFDASTQLVLGSPKLTYNKLSVPKGILLPVCVMNVAFKAKILPYYYQAPMFGDINRFADIWSGIEVKKAIDKLGYAMVTGYATVYHERASNPFVNLVKEARGIGMNEEYGKDDYFKLYQNNIKLWKKYLKE